MNDAWGDLFGGGGSGDELAATPAAEQDALPFPSGVGRWAR